MKTSPPGATNSALPFASTAVNLHLDKCGNALETSLTTKISIDPCYYYTHGLFLFYEMLLISSKQQYLSSLQDSVCIYFLSCEA